jgi:chromosome segregation ATPase
MNIATIIERIVGKQRERQAARAADFRDIVIQIADGNEPDAEFVAQVLDEAGKSLDDLKKAVELLQHRRQLRQKWDAIPGLMDQRHDVEQQMAEADRELEAAESKHFATMNPLSAQLDQLRAATQEGENAKRELWNTCSDPALLAKLADVRGRLAKAEKETADLQTSINNLKSWAKSDRERAEQQKRILGGDQTPEDYLNRAKDRERQAAEEESKLAKIKKVVADLQREEASIRNQMLVP